MPDDRQRKPRIRDARIVGWLFLALAAGLEVVNLMSSGGYFGHGFVFVRLVLPIALVGVTFWVVGAPYRIRP